MKLVYSEEISPYIENINEIELAYKLREALDVENCFSAIFNAKIIDEACYKGFFPMSTVIDNKWSLVLKMHKERCLIDFKMFKVKNKVKKAAKKYKLTFNKNFNKCVEMINERYNDSWLSEPLIKTFNEIRKNENSKTKFCSFELWENEKLIAGEIGFIVGACYSSLSGFHTINDSGNIQLYLTNEFLKEKGFEFWDLGMELDYKIYLGGVVLKQNHFLERYFKVRDLTTSIKI